jgi:hypothetical protein
VSRLTHPKLTRMLALLLSQPYKKHPLLLLSLQHYNRGMSLNDLGRTLFIRHPTAMESAKSNGGLS